MTHIWNRQQIDSVSRMGHLTWYEIKNRAAGAAEVMIYDAIGEYGVTARDFIRDISNISGDLTIHMNTEGGEVFDGLAIYNALKQRPGKVRVVIDSLAASIGSVIAMAGDEVVMAKNARLMIHDAQGVAMGSAVDMQKMANLLADASDNIASIYAERTGTEPEEWRERMVNETWIGAEEAVDLGLVDEIQGSPKAAKIERHLRVHLEDAQASDKIDIDFSGFAEQFRQAMKEAAGA